MKRIAAIGWCLMYSLGLLAQTNTNTDWLVVDKNGSGTFTTIQQALDALPHGSVKPVTIFVKKGVYYEKLLIDSFMPPIRLMGEDKMAAIISYNDHTGKIAPNGEVINTYSSWSVRIKASNFTAENISFRNDAGATAGQAVAVETIGDKLIFKNCRFVGYQDVLFTSGMQSRQYFEDCYIEGSTDFIFGAATAWFERCHIHSKKNSYITAASTLPESAYGYVFNRCNLTADSAVQKVMLGRPWRPYAKVLFMRCIMQSHIRPEGWHDWNKAANRETAFFAEYCNAGPGAATNQRVPWAKQLTKKQAKAYTLKKVFKDWDPTR